MNQSKLDLGVSYINVTPHKIYYFLKIVHVKTNKGKET